MHIEVKLAIVLYYLRLIILEVIVSILVQRLAHTNTIVHVFEHNYVAEVGVNVCLATPVSIAANSSFEEERTI
jgi:hypothetical protein